MQTNSIKCTVCIKWIHKCSGLCGDRCKRCDGTIQDADLAGGLVVDGET